MMNLRRFLLKAAVHLFRPAHYFILVPFVLVQLTLQLHFSLIIRKLPFLQKLDVEKRRAFLLTSVAFTVFRAALFLILCKQVIDPSWIPLV